MAARDLGVGWSPLPAKRSRAGKFLRVGLLTASPPVPGQAVCGALEEGTRLRVQTYEGKNMM